MPLWLYLTVLGLLLPFALLFNSGMLWATAKLFRVRRLSFWRACGTLGVTIPISLASVVAELMALPTLNVILALTAQIIMIVLIHRWGEAGWWRSTFTSIVFMVATFVAAVPQALVLRSTIAHAYVDPTNSMAPTINAGDRFIADRTLTPHRWDVVVYRSPPDGRVVYVRRVIGLPGETTEIIDGRVHINGSRVGVPVELEWLRYESRAHHPRYGAPRGVQGSPVTLGPDEYFVVGDNSASSEDSRHTPPVPGYQPGAVPRSHLRGVVRVVYSPWSRMRALR